MMRSILYVSDSALILSEEEERVAGLVALWRIWNRGYGITGALVLTERHFVQFIEGPKVAIDALMSRIKADKLHTQVRVIEEVEAHARQFDGWSLAYAGPDNFIDRDLAPLLQAQALSARQSTAASLRARLHAMAKAESAV